MSQSLPNDDLTKEQPSKRLISFAVISSVLMHAVIQLAFQEAAILIIRS